MVVGNSTFKQILAKADEMRKQAQLGAAPANPADAAHALINQQQSSEALSNMRNLALLTLGVGAAGRGGLGLLSLFKPSKPKPRTGPVALPLPYPAEKAAAMPAWYMPGMAAAGLGGLGIGWAAVDKLMSRQRDSENDERLEAARQQFHDALLSQYQSPTSMTMRMPKAAADATMQEVGQTLDRIWEKFAAVALEKTAIDWDAVTNNTLGGYGTYAGLSALLGGAWMYDRASKRSRRAVLEKALRGRQQAEFAKSPPPIYATPEPVTALPKPPSVAQLEGQVSEV